jgi:hypothetical protein
MGVLMTPLFYNITNSKSLLSSKEHVAILTSQKNNSNNKRRCKMPKYLAHASYTVEGLKGLLKKIAGF